MKQSSRARRMQRHYRRNSTGRLNLVSLMDIFTILVFFLMVNSSDVQVMQQGVAVKLPESVAEQDPRETLTVTVTDRDILVAGRAVASLEELSSGQIDVVAGLKQELEYQAGRNPLQTEAAGRPITILADRELPYQLLKKIMSTCVSSGYSLISLAVTRKVEPGV